MPKSDNEDFDTLEDFLDAQDSDEDDILEGKKPRFTTSARQPFISSLRSKPITTSLSKSLPAQGVKNVPPAKKRELELDDLDSSSEESVSTVKKTITSDRQSTYTDKSLDSDEEEFGTKSPAFRERATFGGSSLKSGYSIRLHSDDGRGGKDDITSTIRQRQEEQKRFEELDAKRKETTVDDSFGDDFSDFDADSPKKTISQFDSDVSASDKFDREEESAKLLKSLRKEQEEKDEKQQLLYSSLRQQVDELSQRESLLREENQSLKMSTSVRLERLLADKLELDERLKQDEIATAKLKDLNRSLESKIMQEEVNSLLLKQENSRLRESQFDIQRVDDERKKLEDEIRKLREENPQLQSKVDRLEEQNKQLEEQVSKAKQHAQTKMNVVDQENVKLRKEIRDLNEKVLQLTSKLEEAEHQVTQAEWTTSQLKLELEQAKDSTGQIQKEIVTLRRENEKLRVQKKIDENRTEVKQAIVELEEPEKVVPLTEEERKQFDTMKQEIKDQDQLLVATQQDNKRLLDELKTVRKQLKENQEMTSITMNKQNFTNQQDDAKVRELQGRVMELQNQIHYQEQSSYEREIELKQELNRVRDAKKRLEQEYAGANLKEIEQEAYMIQELENRLKSMEMKHQLQVQDLSSKLRWYMENQNMIDASDAEVKNLRQTVKMLEQKLGEAGTPHGQNGQSIMFYKRRVKELENQIAEMKRHEKDPNTITQLIRAVKSDPEYGEESSHVKMLERKVELLESELQETSENASKNLRILKQETDRLTLHYEKQIEELQSELSKYNITFDGPSKKKNGPPLSKVKELQKQLDETRVFYRKKVADLETKLKDNEMKSPREDDDKYKQKAKKLEAELEFRNEKIKRLEQQLLERPASTAVVGETKTQLVTPIESKRDNEGLRRDTEQLKRELDQYKREAEQYRTQYEVLLQQRSQWTVERKDDISTHEYQRVVRELEECKMKLEVVSMAKTTIMSHAEEMIRAAQVETQQMRSQYENENKQIRTQVESEKRDLVERQERELRWYKEQLEQYKQQLIEAQHVNRKQLYEEQTIPPKKRLVVDKDRVEFSAVTNDDRIRQLRFLESRLQDIESNHKLKEMEFNRILHETKHRADMEMSFAKQQFEVAIQEKNREVQKFKLQLQNIMAQLTILKQNRQQVVPVLRRATATTTTVPQVQSEPPTTPNENQNRIFEKRNQETSEKEVIPVASPPPKPRTQVVPQPYVK